MKKILALSVFRTVGRVPIRFFVILSIAKDIG
jgi:hypothetical protein